ncbi:MAG: UDP-N-acetylmuramoyl-tripeptide--D-alanyl-D-alanine ligase [Thalassolituus sp.]
MLREPTLAMIAEITSGTLISGNADTQVSSVSTDTRTLGNGSLYIPLTGERFDGHAFAAQAQSAGAVAMLAVRDVETDLAVIRVADTLRALADIAAWHRDQFDGPVAAVTGSAGKTTVKHLMGAVLSEKYRTLITQGNLNNHIGAPLTLLSLSPEHEAAMIELGASAVGEIEYTARLVRPQVGILTNVVPAHLEGFGSVDNIALTKGELIDAVADDGAMVLNADDVYFSQWVERAGQRRVISFGLDHSADISAENIRETLAGSEFDLKSELVSGHISLGFPGLHNVRNALAVIAAAHALGLSDAEIISGLERATPVSGRLERCTGHAGQVILNDAYNANPVSFKAAIDVLALADTRRVLVMGDMAELGDDARAMHASTGAYAAERNIELLVATGELSAAAFEAFGTNVGANTGSGEAHWFATQSELIEFLKQNTSATDTLLVKGSRSAGMDKVVHALTEQEEEN